MQRIPRHPPSSPLARYVVIGVVALVSLIVIMLGAGGGLRNRVVMDLASGRKALSLISWNMAAINNNPFEYWITYDEDPSYDKLMQDVSSFIDSPGEKDVPVHQVFTDAMFEELCTEMQQRGIGGVNETRARWTNEYRNRKIISEFIKDGVIGKKRLASMPDRITNTINSAEGPVYRPTVINCYSTNFASFADWWSKWKTFMFTTSIKLSKDGVVSESRAVDMLQKIKHAKYPSISSEEEEISIPLQAMSIGIFDAVLVHMMNALSPTWQKLRSDICTNLNLHKNDRSLEILQSTYPSEDMYFLQEVSFSFISKCRSSSLADSYDVYSPAVSDSERDQNSVIALHKYRFQDVVEVTQDVLKEFKPNAEVPIADGDLLVILCTDIVDGSRYLLASFHGDTNGLATVPVVQAVHRYATSKQRGAKLIFGMDANTYEKPELDQQGVTAFAEFFSGLKLNSCYGQEPDPSKYTTFAARTHLQPQLNKAVAYNEKDVKGDKNPKDFVLFFDSDFEVKSAARDNTGVRAFTENTVIPTLQFPSDHAITFSTLLENQ